LRCKTTPASRISTATASTRSWKWDPSNSRDNASAGLSGRQLLDACRLDGTLLWRIDLGRNIRAGAHYTQFLVYDFDGDGRAEVACMTADGTIDGVGNVIGDAAKDYRSPLAATDRHPDGGYSGRLAEVVWRASDNASLRSIRRRFPRATGCTP
jgi:hypothetical protein